MFASRAQLCQFPSTILHTPLSLSLARWRAILPLGHDRIARRRCLSSSTLSDTVVDTAPKSQCFDMSVDKIGLLRAKRSYLVLGIESSCDDSAAAVVKSDGTILSRVSHASWTDSYRQYGGIMPMFAADEHRKHLEPIVRKALEQAQITTADIDAIALTTGPGIVSCLQAGREIAAKVYHELDNSVPVIGVNHIEAHALSPRITHPDVNFPYLVLLASGGHGELLICLGPGLFKRLGRTCDDAPGEAFDKVARILDLDMSEISGGLAIERAATAYHHTPETKPMCQLPVPMSNVMSCDFSFAGLKCAVKRFVDQHGLENIDRNQVAFAFQEALAAHLVERVTRATRFCQVHSKINGITQLVFAGGVACNDRLRKALEPTGLKLIVPPTWLCADNAAMIAWTAIEHIRADIAIPVPNPAEVYVRAKVPLGEDWSFKVLSARINLVPVLNPKRHFGRAQSPISNGNVRNRGRGEN